MIALAESIDEGPSPHLPSAGLARGGLVILQGQARRFLEEIALGDGLTCLQVVGPDESEAPVAGGETFTIAPTETADLLELFPFLTSAGITEETFSLDLRCCAEACYLESRGALLQRVREAIGATPPKVIAVAADGMSGLGSVLLSELASDLDEMVHRRHDYSPAILRVPIFPVGIPDELSRTTLYALAMDLEHHLGRSHSPGDKGHPNPFDLVVLSDYDAHSTEEKIESGRTFLAELDRLVRWSSVPDRTLALPRTWRRGYGDLVRVLKSGGLLDFRRKRVLRELEDDSPLGGLSEHPSFRQGKKAYLELDERYRRLLEAASCDYYPDRVTPGDGLTWAEYGAYLLEKGRDQEAFDAFDRAVEYLPDSAEAFEGLAKSLLFLGAPEEAMANFTKAIQLDPERAHSHEGIILCYLASGRIDLAVKHRELAAAHGCELAPEVLERLQMFL